MVPNFLRMPLVSSLRGTLDSFWCLLAVSAAVRPLALCARLYFHALNIGLCVSTLPVLTSSVLRLLRNPAHAPLFCRRSSNCIDPSIRSPRRWNAAGDGDQTMGHKCVLWSFLRGVWSSTTVSGICVVLCCLVLCCLVLPSAVLVAKQEKKWRFR